MCDTAVLTPVSVMSPGDGTEVVDIMSINIGDCNLSTTVTHLHVGNIRQWPPVLEY